VSKSRTYALLALAAAAVAALVVVFAPTYTSCSSNAACHGDSALAVNGPWIVFVVSVPVVLTLIPVLIDHRASRAVAAVVLWLCCVVALLSVGIFFVPAAILLTIAAARRDPVHAGDGSIVDR
jgi:hypothetical protein